MKPEAQRIAIAETCGWDCDPLEAHEWQSRGQWACRSDRKLVGLRVNVPDYLNDLNAMHKAEMKLSDPEAIKYRCIITSMGINNGYDPFLAPASKRAEAYLKTVNKWEDSRHE
jgi:hypothetical protein